MNARLVLIAGLVIIGLMLLTLGAGILAYGSPGEFFQVIGVGVE